MAKNDNLKDFVTDIADAIREKKGTTDLINPQNFSDEIRNIETGGDIIDVDALPTEDIDNDKIYKLTTPKGMFAYIDPEYAQFIDLQIPNYIYVSSIDDVTEPMLSEVETANSYIYVDTSSFIGYIFISETERKTLSQFFNEFAGMNFVDRGKIDTIEDVVESGVYYIPQGEETTIGVPDINYDKGLCKYNGFNWERLSLNKYDVAGKWQEISSGNIYEFKIDGKILVNGEYNFLSDNYKIIDNKVYMFDMDGNQSEPLLYIKSEYDTKLARLDNKNFIYNKIEDFKGDEKTLDYDQASGIWYVSSLDDNGKVESIMYYIFPLLQDENGKRNVKVYGADSEGFHDSTTPGMTYRIDGNQIKLEMESEGEINDAGTFDYEVVDNKVHLTMDGEIFLTKIVTGLGANDNGQFVSNYIPQNGLYNSVTLNDPEALFFSAVVDVSGSSGGGEDMLQQRVDIGGDTKYLFYGYTGDNVDYISGLDTSKCTNMYGMFYNSKVTRIPFLNTSNVEDIRNAFYGCTELKEIPDLDFGKVIQGEQAFRESGIVTINNLNLSSATHLRWMFQDCKSLTTINAINLDSAVEVYGLFYGCTSLTTVPDLNLPNATSPSYIFQNCTSLVTAPIINAPLGGDMRSMFYGCTSLTTVPDVSLPSATMIGGFFENCSSLVVAPSINAPLATSATDLFCGCTSLTTVPDLNLPKVTSASYLFQDCTSLVVAPKISIPSAKYVSSLFEGCTSLTTVPDLDLINLTGSSDIYMFNKCSQLQNITLKNIRQGLVIAEGNVYGTQLSVDSLINTIKELWVYTSGSHRLYMGGYNTPKLSDVYVKLVDVTDEMIAQDPNIANKMPCEVCESTDEGAMLITTYANNKGWTIA